MPPWLVRVVGLYAKRDRELVWAIGNGKWTFGRDDLADLMARVQAFDDRDWADQIDTHVLALVGEGEHFFDPRLAHSFQSRLTSARSSRVREFHHDEGGDLHCRNGAIHLAHEEIFDWIRTTVLPDREFLDRRPYTSRPPGHQPPTPTTRTTRLSIAGPQT